MVLGLGLRFWGLEDLRLRLLGVEGFGVWGLRPEH